jgi:hypothetical protein
LMVAFQWKRLSPTIVTLTSGWRVRGSLRSSRGLCTLFGLWFYNLAAFFFIFFLCFFLNKRGFVEFKML